MRVGNFYALWATLGYIFKIKNFRVPLPGQAREASQCPATLIKTF